VFELGVEVSDGVVVPPVVPVPVPPVVPVPVEPDGVLVDGAVVPDVDVPLELEPLLDELSVVAVGVGVGVAVAEEFAPEPPDAVVVRDGIGSVGGDVVTSV
jgi:hypothetical protein